MSLTRTTKRIPPLENGDRLTRAEFDRRYQAMPDVKKAELINGVVFLGSPVSLDFHGEQHWKLITWLGVFEASTPGIVGGDNITLRLDSKNEPQPDATLMVRPEYGGQVKKSGNYVTGGPELVAEISGTTTALDLNDKLEVYALYGVNEYIVWRTHDEELDWFVLRGGEYVRLEPDPSDGLLKSAVFPGLWLDSAELVSLNIAAVLAALSRGTASPEHAALVRQLAARRRT